MVPWTNARPQGPNKACGFVGPFDALMRSGASPTMDVSINDVRTTGLCICSPPPQSSAAVLCPYSCPFTDQCDVSAESSVGAPMSKQGLPLSQGFGKGPNGRGMRSSRGALWPWVECRNHRSWAVPRVVAAMCNASVPISAG